MMEFELSNSVCVNDIPINVASGCLDIAQTLFNPNAEQSFECKTYLNTEQLSKLIGINTPVKEVSLSFEIPIMIQARWHKKNRIRKKWLRRYGMKPDTVYADIPRCDVEFNARTGQTDFNTNYIKYTFRQDQLRKGIKIDM